MNEIITTVIGLCVLVGFFGLCVRVNLLLKELRKQGEQREDEAKRIIILLNTLTGG